MNDTQLTVPIIKAKDKKSDRVSLILKGTRRAGRNVRGLIDERIAVGVEYRRKPFLSVTPTYLYRTGQPVRGRSRFESRFRLDVQLEIEVLALHAQGPQQSGTSFSQLPFGHSALPKQIPDSCAGQKE